MCSVSMVGDFYKDKWTDPYRWRETTSPLINPQPISIPTPFYVEPVKAPLSQEEVVRRAVELTRKAGEAASKQLKNEVGSGDDYVSMKEFAKLREEVLEMHELLKRAAQYDRDNGEPHCEMQDKVALLKQMAAVMGVSLNDIFDEQE